MNKQLTNNQIKDIVSQVYQISGQMQTIYRKCRVPFLYHLHRKMQVNYVLLSEILTERLEKNNKQDIVEKEETTKSSEQASRSKKKTQLISQAPQNENIKAPLLGGVHLYNEGYARGLSREGQFDEDEGKNKNFNQKKAENFIISLMEEINTKAEVEVDSISE